MKDKVTNQKLLKFWRENCHEAINARLAIVLSSKRQAVAKKSTEKNYWSSATKSSYFFSSFLSHRVSRFESMGV